jgi:D-alanine-D-alanine ligase
MQIINLKSVLFDWQEKYESDGSNEVFPINMDTKLEKDLTDISKKIYTLLGCRGLARIDFRVRGSDIYFLEVNTFPGITQASFIPKMWRKTGKKMRDLIHLLIDSSL